MVIRPRGSLPVSCLGSKTVQSTPEVLRTQQVRVLGAEPEIGPYRSSCWCRLSPWLGLDQWEDVAVYFTLSPDSEWAGFLTRPEVVCGREPPRLVYGPEVLQSADSESVDVSIRFWSAPVPLPLGSSGLVRSSADDVVVFPLEVLGLRPHPVRGVWGVRVAFGVEAACEIPMVIRGFSLASTIPWPLGLNWCMGEVSIMGCIGARPHWLNGGPYAAAAISGSVSDLISTSPSSRYSCPLSVLAWVARAPLFNGSCTLTCPWTSARGAGL